MAVRTSRSAGLGWLAALGVLAGAAVRAIAQRARRLDLRERVVLITGGSRGLGFMLAEEFGARGAKIAICGRDPTAVAVAHRRLRSLGVDVLSEACDLGDRQAAEAFVDRVAAWHGRIDVVINNAGTIQVGPLESAPPNALSDAMRNIFWSAAHVTMRALPWLRQPDSGGRLVNIGSVGGRVATPHMIPYSAAKFALVGFSEGLAEELRSGKNRVLVTTVLPGPMRTGSIYNAEFSGRQRSEFAWFSLLASLPLVSISGRRAARRVVRAAIAGRPLVHLGLIGHLLPLIHGVAPGLTIRLLAAMNRLLPRSTPPHSEARRGREIDTRLAGSPLLALSDRAARRNNEEPPPPVR